MLEHRTYLVSFPGPSRRATHIRGTLEELEIRLGPAAVVGVDAFLDPARDRLHLMIRVATRLLEPRALEEISKRVVAAGGLCLCVETLSDGDRRRLQDLQNSCDQRLLEAPALVSAVDSLLDLGPRTAVRPRSVPPAVRFRHGDRWLPGRLVAMDERGASVAAHGGLRVGDTTVLEIALREGTAKVSGMVMRVTKPSVASDVGVGGFSIAFQDTSAADIRRCVRWVAAQMQDVAPPPARSEQRYPLDWPATVELARPISARLCNVSQRGLLLEADLALAEQRSVSVRIPCDRRELPVRFEARVVRLAETAGRCCIGLQLPETGDPRFSGFVSRVASRADKNIVLGAEASRLDELVKEFSSSGYAARGAADARSLFARSIDERPDLVIAHDSLGESAIQLLKNRLATRDISFLRTSATAVELRRLVDAALVA